MQSKSPLETQYETISNWDIINKNFRYNDSCQVMYLDEKVGDGYFDNHNFGAINLARVNCKFNKKQTLVNNDSRHAYWIYIILHGHYQMFSSQKNHQYDLLAPSIMLLKGDVGEMVATIPANVLLNSFYIEFDRQYFVNLQQQMQTNPNYHQSILRHFFYQDESFCFIPLTQNPTTNTNNSHQSNDLIVQNLTATQIINKAWQLYNTPIPKDDINMMALHGAAYSFISELLLQSFSELYCLNIDYHLDPTNNTQFNKVDDININQDYDNKHYLHAIQAKLLLDQFYYESWTIRELAKKVNTNECYLKKDFKALTGLTIGGYRKYKRMQQAKVLLIHGFKTIEIANKLGFSSHDYFLKTFQNFYYCHPNDFLK